MHEIRDVVFSGGGFKGFAFIGAIHEIKKKYKIDWGAQAPLLDSVTGCSIGSLISLLIVLGYSSSELDHIVDTTNFQSLIKVEYLPGAISLDSGQNLKEFILQKIYEKILGDESLTLFQLHKKRKTLLRIAVANMETGLTELLDAQNYPDVKVIDAIMASVALPPVFPPIEINNTLYADAGLVNYYPIDLASNNINTCKLLGFRLQSITDLKNIKNELNKSMFPFATYLKQVYDIVSIPLYNSIWELLPKELQEKTVTIFAPEANTLEAGFNPQLISNIKQGMIQAGKNSIIALNIEK